MEENKTDVMPESSTGEVSQEVVTEQAEVDQQPQVEVAENVSIETAPPVGIKRAVEEVDEIGVPYKNRFMEAQRKLESTQKQQEEILRKLDTLQSSQQQKYTVDELETFAAQTDNDAHRIWANKEIRKLQQEKVAEVVRGELSKYQEQQTIDHARQATLNEVMHRYPDAFLRNQAGQTVGWNNDNALTRRIGEYMQDPEIARNPRGLMVAAALAYSDVSLTQTAKTRKQAERLKDEVKTLQKKTMIDGGGSGDVVQKTARQAAIEKSRSGNPRDAVDAIKELWKATGRLS